MIAPSGTKPASRMPKTVPAMTATTKPQSEPAGTQCGTYHHSSRPIAEPTMPNQRTVVVQPMRSPRAPKAALNRMLPAKTIEVISSQRLCPQPRVSAMTVGRMMNMPNCGAVLIRRVRKPIITRLFVNARCTPEKITWREVSPSGASRREPCFSRTPSQAIRKPAITISEETAMAQRSPKKPPPKAGIRPIATSEPMVGMPPVNMT